jgi:two-component system sensor histidine kinase AlgZ
MGVRPVEPARHERSFVGEWLFELRDAWWVYVFAPVAIMLIAGAWGRSNSLQQVAVFYGVSACATLGIGSVTQLGFVFARRRLGHWPSGATALLAVLVGVLVGTELGMLMISAWASIDFMQMRKGMWVIGGTCAVVISGAGVITDRLRDRAQAGEARAQMAERGALEAQLAALQARMDPHFFFNSLNTVAALIEEDPRRAERAVEQLAELFRYTIERGPSDQVSLQREFDVVRDYLELEQLRFEERLHVSMQLPPELEGFALPPLLIQPLAENAIQHGVAHSSAPVHVRVQARCLGDRVELIVRDDAMAVPHPSQGTQSALDTLQRRLTLNYEGAASFSHGPLEPQGYEARMLLPFDTARA